MRISLIRWTARLGLFLIPPLLSLVLSVGIMASSTLSGLVTNTLARVGIHTAEGILTKENKALKAKQARQIASAKVMRSRVVKRAKTSTVRNIATMPAEAIPVLGVATIVAVTALEVDDMCAIVEYTDELMGELNIDPDRTETEEMCLSWRKRLADTKSKISDAGEKTRDRLCEVFGWCAENEEHLVPAI